MMLTAKGRYAVMAVVDMANNIGHKPIKLSDIAERQSIALNYLEQIFLKLKKAGLVKSVKGPGGGYLFAIDSKDITAADIIDAVEENIDITRCQNGRTSCMPNNAQCIAHHVWDGLSKHIRVYLNSLTIAEVANGNGKKVIESTLVNG